MWYFEEQEVWDKFNGILVSQVGAKFQHMAMVPNPGGAFDCSTFPGWCYAELGIVKDVRYPHYDFKWFQSHPTLLQETVENILRERLDPALEVIELPLTEVPMRGDIGLVWTYRKDLPNHTVICLENEQFIHSRWGKGIEIMPYKLSWAQDKLCKLYRIKRK